MSAGKFTCQKEMNASLVFNRIIIAGPGIHKAIYIPGEVQMVQQAPVYPNLTCYDLHAAWFFPA